MDKDMNILDDITFDGWCRCSFSIDLNGDGQDEVLVGSGDGSFLAVKLDKANKLGIKVISENEFQKKIEEAELE